MSEYSDQIRRAVRQLAGVTYETFPATVTAVEKESVDVKPLDSEAEISGVRLKAALDGNDSGIVIVPKQGSTVLVTKIGGSDEECFVSMVAEAQEIRVKIGEVGFFLDADGMVFNGGKFGGLVKVEELKSELKKITDYLAAIKQVFGTSWVPVPSDGGAALKAAMNAAIGSRQLPDFGRIEDKKVQH